MMDLSAHRILEVWEQGVSGTVEDKTLALLSLAESELSKAMLAERVLGERNKNLLDLHQRLFGSTLQAYVECNKCGEALELEFGLDEFGFDSINDLPETHSISIENIIAQVRLPNSHDLVALESLNDIEEGRYLLFSRCVLELRRDDSIFVLHELNEDEMNQLEEAISGLDPRMEILFNLQCPQCTHTWQSPLDIGSFLWNEYDTYARKLLEDVHTLASSYGWSETDILTMSQQRRRYYLQRIMQ
jgi:hypothetical protein